MSQKSLQLYCICRTSNMSLDINVRGPEGLVFVTESRVTLDWQFPDSSTVRVSFDTANGDPFDVATIIRRDGLKYVQQKDVSAERTLR